MRRALQGFLIASLALSPALAGAKPAKRRPPVHRAPAAATAGAPDEPMAPDEAPSDEAAPRAAESPPPDAAPPRAVPAQAPAAEAKSEPTPPPAPSLSIDLQKLRADYDRLRDELFRARTRAALVQEGLYTSRLGARLEWEAAPDFVIRHAEVRLDGGTIWDSGDKPVTDDVITVADRPCKPGPHSLTLRLEVRPGTKKKGDVDGLGYVTEQTFALAVADGKLTTVVLTGDEDGDLPGYEPQLELELETEAIKK